MQQIRLLRPIISWFLQNATYLIFVILGIPTLGLFWPAEFSHMIISTGHRVPAYYDKPDDTNHDQE
jgi:hypothetical protein